MLITSVQGDLAKGQITVLSLLAVANAFIRCGCWAVTFARGGRQCKYDTVGRHMFSLESTLPMGAVWAPSNMWFLGPTRHLDLFICSNLPYLCTVCLRCGLIIIVVQEQLYFVSDTGITG